MRILVVEDDENFLAEYLLALNAVPGLQVTTAKSRDAAVTCLETEFFDVIGLDLKLPTTDHAMDLDITHGEAVFGTAQSLTPGTPVLFLTGSQADPIYESILETKEKVDLWGDGTKVDTIQLKRKSQVAEFVDIVAGYAKRIAELNTIEISRNGLNVELSEEDKRVIRVMARSFGGTGVSLASTDGGLSASRVLRMTVVGDQGGEKLRAIVKLAGVAAVDDEEGRVRQLHVLRQGDYAPFISTVKAGTRRAAGILYRLADDFDSNAFALLAQSDDRAAAAVAAVKQAVAPWLATASVQPTSVAAIRAAYLQDDVAHALAAQYGLSIQQIEQKVARSRRSCAHGDLHGVNVLIGQDDRPILIDFGDVGINPSAMDPITMELSLFSHPAGQAVGKGWKPDFTVPWRDLAAYSGTSPFPNYIKATRQWAHEAGFGDDDVYANAYGYCLKQLKYPDTDKEFFKRATEAMLSYLA